MNDNRLKEAMVKYSHLVYHKQWVANHDGNLSARCSGDLFLLTPTSFSKGDITSRHLITVDSTGKRRSGRFQPFSEFQLHRAVYNCRPDVNAIIHAHPTTASGFAVCGLQIDGPFMPEAVVSIGDTIPLVPYFFPGAKETEQDLGRLAVDYDAVLMENHGVISWGDDLEQAFLRIELVEHLAKIALVARQLGGSKTLPPEDVQVLLSKRYQAGLGPEARNRETTPKRGGIIANSTCIDAKTEKRLEEKDLEEIITREVVRVLKGGGKS